MVFTGLQLMVDHTICCGELDTEDTEGHLILFEWLMLMSQPDAAKMLC